MFKKRKDLIENLKSKIYNLFSNNCCVLYHSANQFVIFNPQNVQCKQGLFIKFYSFFKTTA